jgi:phosphoglycolate phosphatase-like HAD superfamily hydrolase
VFRITEKKHHVFDCDGVLFDSNALKVEALKDTFQMIGSPVEFINLAAEEFRLNFGRTRRDHFDAFLGHETVDGYRMDPLCVDSALEYYGKQVQVLYSSCPIVKETLNYISLQVSSEYSFVVSASSQAELRNILPYRIPYFSEDRIFGGPIKKVENLQEIAAEVGAENMVFYGDSVQDAMAAIEVGVTFVGLAKYAVDPQTLKHFCINKGLKCFDSCLEIIS